MPIRLLKSLFLFTFVLLTASSQALAQSPTPQTNPYYTGKTNHIINQRYIQNQPPQEQQQAGYKEFQYSQKKKDYASDRKPPEVQQGPGEAKHRFARTSSKKPSALENMYSRRIVDELEQFGYDLFGIPNESTRSQLGNLANLTTPPMGAVQDDFTLGAGDELDITFTGQRSDQSLYRVNSNGNIIIKDFPPIPAAGRTIAQVRLSVQAAADNLYNTQAYISLSSIRQIGILVVGHVKQPGRKNLTVFHTILDALMESGGIEKTGSLRQIKLVRNGRSQIIDLYALLMHGTTNIDLRLKDGDRIIIPAIGPTVAISGEIKRPGIFELRTAMRGMMHKPENKAHKLSLNQMLELSGGVLSPGKNRFLKIAITPSGNEDVQEIADAFTPTFGDGAILKVSKGDEKRLGTIELTGHTRRPGIHTLTENKTLRQLIESDSLLGPDIYPLIGIIKRWNSLQLSHELLDFPLKLVLSGDFDRGLNDGDQIILFSNKQIQNLYEPEDMSSVQNVAYGSGQGEENESIITDPTLASFLKERSVFVRGAVRSEGSYPVATGATLDNLLAVAGGLSLEANTSNIEITSALQGEGHQAHGRSGTRRIKINTRETAPVNVPIGPGDSVRINQKFKKIEDKSVVIAGEVTNPGGYDLVAGDKLSDLLRRAGGITHQAYADGAIFSRAAERKAEEARFKSQARSMRQAIAAALEKDDGKINPAQIAEARSLAKELEMAEGVGRITVTASPEILALNPELDLLLEPGDRLYIPKRSLTVRVSGEVLSSAALQFREDKAPLDYIHEAGGFTFHADKDRTFVLYPDGSAQPLQVSSWNYNPIFIPPGSTVIVPRDPKPFDFIESAKDVSQILSNLAITAIFVDDVRDDD